MTRQVNLYEAKTNLSQLVEDAAKGEEIIIAKNGKPMAKLVVVDAANSEQPEKRALGQWAHLVDPNDKRTDEEWWRDWKALDAEIERDFEEGLNRDLQALKLQNKGESINGTLPPRLPTSSSGRKKDRPDSPGPGCTRGNRKSAKRDLREHGRLCGKLANKASSAAACRNSPESWIAGPAPWNSLFENRAFSFSRSNLHMSPGVTGCPIITETRSTG